MSQKEKRKAYMRSYMKSYRLKQKQAKTLNSQKESFSLAEKKTRNNIAKNLGIEADSLPQDFFQTEPQEKLILTSDSNDESFERYERKLKQRGVESIQKPISSINLEEDYMVTCPNCRFYQLKPQNDTCQNCGKSLTKTENESSCRFQVTF